MAVSLDVVDPHQRLPRTPLAHDVDLVGVRAQHPDDRAALVRVRAQHRVRVVVGTAQYPVDRAGVGRAGVDGACGVLLAIHARTLLLSPDRCRPWEPPGSVRSPSGLPMDRYGRAVRRAAVCAAVLGVLLAGCSTPVPGAPAPAPDSAAPTVELPPRPREVRLDGLDPCTLLTESDRRGLGLDQRPVLDVAPSALYGGVTQLCSIGGFEPRAISVGVELSVTGGVELFFRPGVRSEIRPIEVGGFPAIVAVPVQVTDFCTVVVDVAPRQAVDVQFADGGRVPPIPQERLCSDAQQVAALVMVNLLIQH